MRKIVARIVIGGCLTIGGGAIAAYIVIAVFIATAPGDSIDNLQAAFDASHRSPQWSADGQFIVIGLRDSIYVVSATGGAVKRIPNSTDDGQFSPTLSSDNIVAYSYVNGRSPTIAAVKLESNGDFSNQTTLAASGNIPEWSPTGQHIAFSSQQRGQAIITDAAGSVIARHQAPADTIGKPAWSYDGQRVAFTWGYHWGCRQCAITVLNLDGSSKTLIEHTAADTPSTSENAVRASLSSAVWSQDGQTLYYAFNKGSQNDTILYSIDVDTNTQKPITNLGNVRVRDIYLSPVGNIVMFISTMIEQHSRNSWNRIVNINSLDINRNYIKQIDIPHINASSIASADLQISWSPDGKQIAVVNAKGGLLMITDADGSNAKLLAEYDSESKLVPAYAKPLP